MRVRFGLQRSEGLSAARAARAQKKWKDVVCTKHAEPCQWGRPNHLPSGNEVSWGFFNRYRKFHPSHDAL